MQVNVNLPVTYAKAQNTPKNIMVSLEEGSTIEELLDAIDLKERNVYFCVVGGSVRKSDYILSDKDEISIFPNIFGG